MSIPFDLGVSGPLGGFRNAVPVDAEARAAARAAVMEGVTVCSPCPGTHAEDLVPLLADHAPDGNDDDAAVTLAWAARHALKVTGPVTVHKGQWTEPYGRTWTLTRP